MYNNNLNNKNFRLKIEIHNNNCKNSFQLEKSCPKLYL